MAAYPCVPLSQPDAAARDHHSGRLPLTGYRRTRPRPPSPPAAPPPVPAVLAGLARLSSAARSGTQAAPASTRNTWLAPPTLRPPASRCTHTPAPPPPPRPPPIPDNHPNPP